MRNSRILKYYKAFCDSIGIIDTNSIVPMTDANQNFSKVVRLVEKEGMAVIMKNNRPKYIVVDFDEYEEIVKQ